MTREGLATEEATYENSRIDHFAIWALLFGIFVVSINTSAIISLVFKGELHIKPN